MGNFTQQELAAMYEQQQSREGKLAMAARKDFLQKLWKETGIFIPDQEVSIMINRQTGEKRYFMKG